MSSLAFTRCAVLALAIAALGLSGCGRRGNLDPSPDSGISARQAHEQTAAEGKNAGTSAGTQASQDGTGTKRVRGAVAPNDSFILDPLL